MIEGAKPAVYERIFGRKAGKMIWDGENEGEFLKTAFFRSHSPIKNAGPRNRAPRRPPPITDLKTYRFATCSANAEAEADTGTAAESEAGATDPTVASGAFTSLHPPPNARIRLTVATACVPDK